VTQTQTNEVQDTPPVKRGHRLPVENKALLDSIEQAQAKAKLKQSIIKLQAHRIRMSDKIEQLFGKEAATRYMAEGR
jgi:hypothetical protein